VCRKTQMSQIHSERAAHPGVPYGKVVAKKFHADSINGHKMADAGSRGRPERAQGVNISAKRRSGREFLQEPRYENALYFAYRPASGAHENSPRARGDGINRNVVTRRPGQGASFWSFCELCAHNERLEE